ncbi:MAG: lactate utilization protein [Thermoplasmata archaeon]|nr:lactate utilization protein [Thermoplasmata archaeon]MCI4356257.1 lactate utilization protein [Thermoplasmata archaeon]
MSAASPAAALRSPGPSDPAAILRFGELASEERLRTAVVALEQNGISTTVVSTRAEAVQAVLDRIPSGSEVLDAPSQTLVALGLDVALADPARFHDIRAELMRLREEKKSDAQRKLGASPDVIVGSVHAITEKGQVVIASATGSQLAPYVSGAGKVIWVAGTQKIVADLDAAFQRVQEYTLPRESERAMKAYGFPSFVAKLLVVNREFTPGRIHLVLIRENLGF